MTQSRTLPAGDVMRSRMVLLLAEGTSYQKIQDLLNTTAPTIARWKERFLKHRIAGLMEERHPGQKPSVRTPKLLLKLSQKHGHSKLQAAIESALAGSCYDVAAVRHLLSADELRHASCEAIDVGALERYARPLPAINEYDQLLTAGGPR